MMKKITTIMMALMMVLGLTQCKKQVENNDNNQDGPKVRVSCVMPINNGGKSEFANVMTDGTIKWSAGTERIYLAIPDETNPQIVEMTTFTTVESNILAFEGEVAEGLLTAGQDYEVWYLGNSKESGNSYITEEIENEVIKSISGSIASQSGDLDDLGYCHVAMTTVTAVVTENDEVKLNLNGTLKNQIAIAHLNLEGITQLKGDAIVGTEYALQYNNGAFEFAVTPDAKANINVTEGTSASYVVLFPNATANVDLKSNTSKKVTFEGGVEANKIYYKHVSDMEFYPLTWEDYEENLINGHEYVDLGLPSGLLWATCNVGADSPEEYGDYFAWGETTTKSSYYESNSETYGLSYSDLKSQGYIDENYNLMPQYDAATANWGGDWRMPTYYELNELINSCAWEWTTQNGVNGYKVTSKTNGNSIFLPAAGSRDGIWLGNAGDVGDYWSSTPYVSNSFNTYDLIFGSGDFKLFYYNRYYGQSVRPVTGCNTAQYAFVDIDEVSKITANSAIFSGTVITDNCSEVTAKGVCWSTSKNPTIENNKTNEGSGIGGFTSKLSNLAPNTIYYVRAYATNAAGTSYGRTIGIVTLQHPIINGHEYVDLGLPSGLLWSTCNVGASSPEEYGDYFAWGETTTKSSYSAYNSETYGLSYSDLQSQGYIDENGNLKPQYDAATANWGGDWRMPTSAEQYELLNNCTWTWTTQNGVKGYKVTSKVNSNYIFLPAVGCRDGSSFYNAGSFGYFWSSTPRKSDGNLAYYLYFASDYYSMRSNLRSIGLSVRPVLE